MEAGGVTAYLLPSLKEDDHAEIKCSTGGR